MRDLLKILLAELILFIFCIYVQPDLIISNKGQIQNSTERINAFKSTFSYTLPIQLFLIFRLIKKISFAKDEDGKILKNSVKSISYSVSAILIIIIIYLSNST